MAETSSEGSEFERPSRSRRLDGVAWGLVALGLLGATANALSTGSALLQSTALLGHGFLLATGAAILARHRGTVFAITLWFVIVLACFPAFPRTLPERRELAFRAHLIAGFVGVALGIWASGIFDKGSRWRRWGLTLALLGLLSAPAMASVVRDWRAANWQPPRYDDSAWRFLTATSAEQTDVPAFPSALRAKRSVSENCADSGCHRADECRIGAEHLTAPDVLAYRKAHASFVRRRGTDASRWCDGCHGPQTAESIRPGLSCGSCHLVSDVHGGYGSAALTLAGSMEGTTAFAAQWRPRRHNGAMLRPLHRAAEFCGACHRKNWSLPQNGYRFVPGQDEFRQWRESRFAADALLAPGEAAPSKSCLGCHGNARAEKSSPALQLDAFLRPPTPQPPKTAEEAALQAGKRYYLDVVVSNTGIGHDFPTGMADQREAWLEVALRDRSGRALAVSGAAGERHRYRLVGLDREGKPIAHGDLDRMARASEWRKIPSGGSDLARYEFIAPATVRAVGIRLLRQVTPEVARWSGQAVGPVETVAEVELSLESESKSKSKSSDDAGLGVRWRRYAEALAAVKAYPFAVQAMQRSLALQSRDVESLIGLGRIFLAEGDVLSAQDQFRLARDAAVGDPRQSARISAWLAVATRTAQPAQAVETLSPLVERYPRDPRLRFELGRALMDLLRNREAAVQFKAMLDADPLDVTAHYNLMLCYQRLNQLSEARREEVVYRLMAAETDSTLGREAVPSRAREAQPLHVHPLRAP